MKIEKVSEEIPIGAFSIKRAEETDTKQWIQVFRTIQPNYLYPDYEIKIVDYNIYNGLKGKESIVFMGKTDDFGSYIKEWKNLMNYR